MFQFSAEHSMHQTYVSTILNALSFWLSQLQTAILQCINDHHALCLYDNFYNQPSKAQVNPSFIILIKWHLQTSLLSIMSNMVKKCLCLYSLFIVQIFMWQWIYRVFFIESGKVICYKILKMWLFHDGFGLRTEVIMGHLISDHFKMHF